MSSLGDRHREALAGAVTALEYPNLAARIAEYAGAPVNRVLGLLPRAADRGLTRVVELALHRCLHTAVRSLDGRPLRKPASLLSTMAVGLTGGVSGLVGLAALPVELPVTTTLMLRAIADIARHEGENLGQLEARVACLHVFGLGARRGTVASMNGRTDVGYYAARTLLTRLTGNAAALAVERGAAQLAAPIASPLLAELVSRFSIVVSDRIAASAVPVIGAVGGATVNLIFMTHFQQVARAHFTIRRLERTHGAEPVRRLYAELAAQR